MACRTEIVGTYSQLIAKAALLVNGWTVSEPDTVESYDFIARDPQTGEWKTFQCKTIRQRADRRDELVVYSTNGKGERYSKSEVDFIIGVWGTEDAPPKIYYFENRELREYWSTENRANKRWHELTLSVPKGEIA